MKVTMILADFAEAVRGKLYIMGGGWSVTGPAPTPTAIAVKIEVPWNQANQRHKLRLELFDGDRKPVLVPAPAGNAPLQIGGDFEVGRPAGLIQGTPIDATFAFNILPIQLQSGSRFTWVLSINEKTNKNWEASFSTREKPKK